MPLDDVVADQPNPPVPRKRRWSTGAIVQVGLLISVLGFWIGLYAWTLTRDADDLRPLGMLVDHSFPEAAEPLCADTVLAIENLGLPTAVDSPAQRADLVVDENVLWRDLMAKLRALPQPTGDQGHWVRQWLDDWDVHIDDRERWAQDLQVGDDHPFTETDRDGEQITRGIDYFAETNRMPSCVSSTDV